MTPNTPLHQDNRNISYLKTLFGGLFGLLLVIGFIFLLAGRTTYWQGWVFAGICVLILLISSLMFINKTDLFQERLKPGPGTKWWDRVFWVFYVPLNCAIIIIASLDAGRFQWTTQLPALAYIISYLVFLLSVFIVTWAKLANRFFSTVVRIQTDRGHQVMENGPYRLVRHPGYIAGILLVTSMPLVLGSLWALIPGGLTALSLIVRTYLEDITLQKELPGYDDYAEKVRFRLLPGIW